MRTSLGAFLILLGASGCLQTPERRGGPTMNPQGFNQPYTAKPINGLVGPGGEPITATRPNGAASIARGNNAVVRAGGFGKYNGGVRLTGGFGGHGADRVPGPYVGGPPLGAPAAPPRGPNGAVAAVGAILPGTGPRISNARTSVKFVGKVGMTVSWLGANMAESTIRVPGRYNFPQGGIYRLKLQNIPKRPTLVLYPTIEVTPATVKSHEFLAHSSVPVNITDRDIEQVENGNYLVKVVYLPDPLYAADLALAGPAEIISSPLEPGLDPVAEARKRGTILLILRLGNIDLEATNTPAITAPAGAPPAVFGPAGAPAGGRVMPKVDVAPAGPKGPAGGRPLTLPKLGGGPKGELIGRVFDK